MVNRTPRDRSGTTDVRPRVYVMTEQPGITRVIQGTYVSQISVSQKPKLPLYETGNISDVKGNTKKLKNTSVWNKFCIYLVPKPYFPHMNDFSAPEFIIAHLHIKVDIRMDKNIQFAYLKKSIKLICI